MYPLHIFEHVRQLWANLSINSTALWQYWKYLDLSGISLTGFIKNEHTSLIVLSINSVSDFAEDVLYSIRICIDITEAEVT